MELNMVNKITGGLYLVVDPQLGHSVLSKVEAALRGGVDIIQLWNNWNINDHHEKLIVEVCDLAHRHNVPVLINEHWQWIKEFPLDGIHFDEIPKNWSEIKAKIDRSFITGITCGNEQENILWAIDNKLDYISFCSMFPSSTANRCDLVKSDTIKQTRKISDIPIFVAGGCTAENITTLLSLGINGVAVVSGILKAEDSEATARKFKQSLQYKNIVL